MGIITVPFHTSAALPLLFSYAELSRVLCKQGDNKVWIVIGDRFLICTLVSDGSIFCCWYL